MGGTAPQRGAAWRLVSSHEILTWGFGQGIFDLGLNVMRLTLVAIATIATSTLCYPDRGGMGTPADSRELRDTRYAPVACMCADMPHLRN